MLRLLVMLFRVGTLVVLSTCVCVAETPLVEEAVRLIRSGSLDEGASRLNAAIEANPEHAANGTPIDGSEPISAEALAHGRRQFQQLAKDRPEILRGGKNFESLHIWAIREFAGASTGSLVDWDSAPPILQVKGAAAESVPPFRGENAKIRIAASVTDALGENRSLEFEDLWHHLAFEFYNLRGTSTRRELAGRAFRGEISRVEYTEKMFRIEHEAVQLTHRFYALKFLPCASAAEMQSDPYHWYVTQPGWWQRQDFINKFPFHSYPWKDFGDRYDALVQMAAPLR